MKLAATRTKGMTVFRKWTWAWASGNVLAVCTRRIPSTRDRHVEHRCNPFVLQTVFSLCKDSVLDFLLKSKLPVMA